MNDLSRIPSTGIVQGASGQGRAGDGKPRLERRRGRKRKKKTKSEDGVAEEALAEDPAKAPDRKSDADAPEDEARGHHIDVRA